MAIQKGTSKWYFVLIGAILGAGSGFFFWIRAEHWDKITEIPKANADYWIMGISFFLCVGLLLSILFGGGSKQQQ